MAEWGGVLAIPEPDSRFLHNDYSDPESDPGRLLGSTPATQWYKVRPCHIETHEIAVFCAGCIRYQAGNVLLDGGYLHNRGIDFDSVCGRLLGLMPAFQQYKVPLCHIKAQAITGFGGEDRYSTSAKSHPVSDTVVLRPDSRSMDTASSASCTQGPHLVASGTSGHPSQYPVPSGHMLLSNLASHASRLQPHHHRTSGFTTTPEDHSSLLGV